MVPVTVYGWTNAPVTLLSSRVVATDGGVIDVSTLRTVPSSAQAAAGETATVVVVAAAVLVVAAGIVVVVVVVLEVVVAATLVVGVVDAGTGCDENWARLAVTVMVPRDRVSAIEIRLSLPDPVAPGGVRTAGAIKLVQFAGAGANESAMFVRDVVPAVIVVDDVPPHTIRSIIEFVVPGINR